MTNAVNEEHNSAPLTVNREQAAQTVERFVRRFDESYRLLAYHAALPLVLTPELVNYLRNEFLRGEEVPWVAEVDLLLSDLCSQVGYELYAMDTHVRAYLLEKMKERYGEGRMQQVAQVLISYVSYLSRLGRRQQELEAQRWAAMTYLGDEKCQEAAQEIAKRLIEVSSGTGSQNLTERGIRAELARLTRITEELSSQLQQESSLLEYARLIQQILRTPEQVNPDDLRRSYRVGDEELTFPVKVMPVDLARVVQPSSIQIEGFPPINTFEFEVARIEVNPSALSSTANLLEMLDEEVFSKTGEYLNNVEQLLIEQTLANQTYEQIAASSEYSVSQVKSAALKLWNVLSEVFGEKATKRNVKKVIEQWEARRRITVNRHRQQAQYFIEDLGDAIQLEMVAIPEGSFLMGSPEGEIDSYDREKPQHEVSVSSFHMGRYPITQEQWRGVAGWEQVEKELDPDPSFFKEPYQDYDRWTRPVESVSWQDAEEFCARLSNKTQRTYRLPTEAEWEYACRAGTTTPFHFGETITTDLANYRGTDQKIEETLYKGAYGEGFEGEYREQTTPVGYFQIANAFGLYDMHGNVWEWCLDPWHDNYQGAPNDGKVWDEENNDNRYQNTLSNINVLLSDERSHIVRGGSWYYRPYFCRSAYRGHVNPVVRNNYIGLRVVCAAPRTQ